MVRVTGPLCDTCTIPFCIFKGGGNTLTDTEYYIPFLIYCVLFLLQSSGMIVIRNWVDAKDFPKGQAAPSLSVKLLDYMEFSPYSPITPFPDTSTPRLSPLPSAA